MDCLTFIGKVAKKLHLEKLAYLMAKPFAHAIAGGTENDICNAEIFLQSLSANPANSCLRSKKEHGWSYDLQVIIPAYNTGKYIERCIDSVLSLPSSRSIIVTVVNDGSQDNTGEVLRKYDKEPRVEVITQENRGFSGARNRALDSIKGRYVTFLDSDDEFLRGVNLDELLMLVDGTDADVLECGYVTFDGETDLRVVRKRDSVSDYACEALYGFPWGKIFKAQLFSGIRFPEGYWFEDTVMAFVVFPMCRKVATSSALLYRYRINPQGITAKARGSAKCLDSYWITEQLLADRVNLGLPNDEAFAEVMLRQVRMNHSRIKSMGRTDVNRAVFVLTANLWAKYFHNAKTSSPLAKALAERDFMQYLLSIEFNQ